VSEAFIYLWYDAPNDMYYLGKHKGSPDDKYTHSSWVWPRFTKDNIPEGVTREILGEGTDEEMSILEHKLLKFEKENGNWDRYYNESLGDPRYVDTSGENNPMYGKKHSPETRKKISIANKRAFLGKTHTTETVERLRQAASGRTPSMETREKMSESRKGIAPWNKGKPGIFSEESRKKMSEAMKGRVPWNKGKKCPQQGRKGRVAWNKGTGMTKEERNRKRRERYARKKAERQCAGTLEPYL